MNGAQALIRTLVDSGVDVCFSNPGTSEMHFVAALDSVPEMRGVLALFEGVATGAADGYARMSGKPAAVLLHLGPGLGNGLANLHNARRAKVPIVNIVGDHAIPHKPLDAPLESDIVAVASNVSTWIRTAESTADLGRLAAEAVAASHGAPGQIATLILPADVSWGDGGVPTERIEPAGRAPVDVDLVTEMVELLIGGEPAMLFLGGAACSERGLVAAARVAAVTGCQVMAETFPTRMARGAGRPLVARLGYLSDMSTEQLKDVKHLITVDAKVPVPFFAYPDKPSRLIPDGCTPHTLAGDADDAVGALEALADALDAPMQVATQERIEGEIPTGDLNAHSVAQIVGALLPEGAIVSDEAVTSSLSLPFTTAGSAPHDWLSCLTGGSIGNGLPVSVGAAIACPDRPVVALQADGSAMYTIQSLWTMARENLDVTIVLYNNASYEILKMELQRTGAEGAGPKANSLLDIGAPVMDFTAMAKGMGVPATRATTAEEFADQFAKALAEPGPSLVEAMIPKLF
jgi:acetolactate synthase-1/2/3 large subunit